MPLNAKVSILGMYCFCGTESEASSQSLVTGPPVIYFFFNLVLRDGVRPAEASRKTLHTMACSAGCTQHDNVSARYSRMSLSPFHGQEREEEEPSVFLKVSAWEQQSPRLARVL